MKPKGSFFKNFEGIRLLIYFIHKQMQMMQGILNKQ